MNRNVAALFFALLCIVFAGIFGSALGILILASTKGF